MIQNKYCSQLEWAFHAKFLYEKPIFFSLLVIFFVPLSLENSQKEKEIKWDDWKAQIQAHSDWNQYIIKHTLVILSLLIIQ